MSLIPSESLNFPDGFRATVDRKPVRNGNTIVSRDVLPSGREGISPGKNLEPQPRPVQHHRPETPITPLPPKRSEQNFPRPSSPTRPQSTSPEIHRRVAQRSEQKAPARALAVPPQSKSPEKASPEAPSQNTIVPSPVVVSRHERPPISPPKKISGEPAKIPVIPRAKVRSLCQSKPVENGAIETHPSNETPLPNGHEVQVTGPVLEKRVEEPVLKDAATAEIQKVPQGRTQRPLMPPPFPNPGRRWLPFLLCETVILGVLIPLGMLGFSHRITDPTLTLLLAIVVIAAAVAAVVVPIIFFRMSAVPRERR